MKSTVRKKSFVGLLILALWGVLCMPVATVEAQTATVSEQLQSLTVSLTTIGNQIAVSPNLSETDRLQLMTQLVAISNQILQLKNGAQAANSYADYLNPPPDTDATKKSAKEAGLTKVRVRFDSKTNEANTEIFYGSKVKAVQYAFTDLTAIADFGNKIDSLRTKVAAAISADTDIKQGDIRKLVEVSARNPVRDSRITPNSALAIELANDFAQYSIVDSVAVLPGNGEGTIEISTDQDEALVLSLQREFDEDGFYYRPSQYTYSYRFYIKTPFDILDAAFDESDELVPKVSESTQEVPASEIEEYVTSLFNEVPFTSTIADFETKLIKFLTENPTQYRTSFSTVDSIDRDCYAKSDKVVVNEFIAYLVNGLTVQYEDPEEITTYIAPIASEDEFYSGSCTNKKRFF